MFLVPGLLLFLAGDGAGQSPIPPPPENDTPAQSTTPSQQDGATTRPPDRQAPRTRICPRCGYLCERVWQHCIACGWDLSRLTGEAEEQRLRELARSTVGLTVAGRPNRHATAFPFGGPGLFLTNGRVLIGADSTGLNLRTQSNRIYPATYLGHDPASGFGLIRAEIPGVSPLEAAPAVPALAEPVWTICYSVVFEDDLVRYMPVSLHRGQVTASGQTGTHLVSLENLLRTDHSIEDGCTGGPLIDSRGRLAGMILGGPDAGITYALPLEGHQPVVSALARQEAPVRPYFGIGLVTPDDRRRARFGIETTAADPLVVYVIRDSPSASAGVRPGDRLAAVGGQRVTGVRDAWMKMLAAAPDGPEVALSLIRGTGTVEIGVKPSRRPVRLLLDPIDELQEALEANLKEIAKGDGAKPGLMVTDIVRGGRGEKVLFQNGDVIVGVDDKPIRTIEEFDTLIRTRFKKIFSQETAGDRRFPSSYHVYLEVRTANDEKVMREYVNLFPDFLAPPVY
jgi:serine protease Do